MYALTVAVVFFSCITLLNLVLFVGLVRRLRSDSTNTGALGGPVTGMPSKVSGLAPGKSAPDLGVAAAAGRDQLVGVFSTDCGACPDYLPRFKSRATSFDGAAIAILGGSAAKHDTYKEQLGPQVITLSDIGAGPMASGPLTEAFEVTSWPSFFIVGPDGIVKASGPDGVQLPVPIAA